MTHYENSIIKATGCSESEVAQVEDIMRHTILHSTLDWLTAKQFDTAAKEAYDVFKAEKYYTSLSQKLFGKDYFDCSESELRQIELAIGVN